MKETARLALALRQKQRNTLTCASEAQVERCRRLMYPPEVSRLVVEDAWCVAHPGIPNSSSVTEVDDTVLLNRDACRCPLLLVLLEELECRAALQVAEASQFASQILLPFGSLMAIVAVKLQLDFEELSLRLCIK